MVVIPNLGGGHLVFGSGEKRYHFQLLLPPIQIPPKTPLHDGNIRNVIVDHACQILKYETYGLRGPRLYVCICKQCNSHAAANKIIQ